MVFDRNEFNNWALHIFSHFSCLPTLSSARIRAKQGSWCSETTYNISSQWKQIDSIRNDYLTMAQEYLVCFRKVCEVPELLHWSYGTMVSPGCCFPYIGESGTILWDIEQSSRRIIITEYSLPKSALGDLDTKKASASLPGTFVHVFCSKSGKKLKTIKLPTENKRLPIIHGRVYKSAGFSAPFSSCRYSSTNSNKIIYLAERSPPDATEYLSTGNAASTPEKSLFLLKENWGEGLTNVIQPVICLLDVETEEVVCLQSELEKMVLEAKNWSFDDPHYAPDNKGVVFIAYTNSPYRLGLKYCYQRPARLMYWNFETSELQCLSREGHAVRWPRFSPDNLKIIWFEMPASGPHNQCFAMLVQDWPPKLSAPKVIVPLVAMPKCPFDFPGLFLGGGVPERCWTADGKGVVLSTTWGVDKALIHIDMTSDPPGRISRFPSPLAKVESGGGYGTAELIEILDDVIIVSVSSPTVPDFLAVSKFSLENITEMSWLNLCLTGEDEPVVPHFNGLAWKALEHKATTEDTRFGVTRFESLLIYPTSNSASLELSEYPRHVVQEVTWETVQGLIIVPHGGPHSAFTAEWMPTIISYVATGFACLLVNYRGSVGYGNSSVYSLPGKCGIIDVADCVQATKEALCDLDMPDLPCFLLGGSHGGFLVLHLAGRHAPLYRAAVARNPVTNLISMLSTTDIPDWCWIEAGIGVSDVEADPQYPERLCRNWSFESNFCPSEPEQLNRLATCSPIVHVSSKWSVPVLMCIGANDKRVPNEQGISFMRALQAHLGDKANEKMCRTLCFPTEAHPIQNPAAVKENFLRAVEWYYQALALLKA